MSDLTAFDSHIINSPDVETVERLMVLRRELELTQSRKAFQYDFSRLQSVLPSIPKNGKAHFATKKGGQCSYSYVKIDDITESLKPILYQYGFSFLFRQKKIGAEIAVSCVIMHSEGYREHSEFTAPIDASGAKNPIQAMASTVSYLKRITFMSALGLSTSDNVQPKPSVPKSELYGDSAFKTNFPIWRLKIQQGSTTPDRIISILKKKGVNLSAMQKQLIREC